MKIRIPTSITLIVFSALLAISPLQAQEQGSKLQPASPKYAVQVLPGLGGLGNAASINNLGLVSGLSEPPGDPYDHAFLWRNGQPTDLGTLGGYNSAIPFPNKNEIGWLAGISETADNDPYQENFCQFTCSSSTGNCLPFNQICKGLLREPELKEMIELPPLPGGTNSYGFDANNKRQIVGAAENSVLDSTCVAPQVFDYEAVVWSLGRDGVPFISQQLPPIAGDVVSAATQINDEGDAVGASGPCASIGLGIGAHAVLWKGGRAIDLGSLGGVTNNIAFAINGQGQVVGISDLTGDSIAHAFLWEHGVMKDIGTLRPDDTFALAGSINDRGEVVGFSCGPVDCRGFHWQAGVMIDLNSSLPADSPLLITNGEDINSRGEIVGQAFDQTVQDSVGVVLTPSDNDEGLLSATTHMENMQRNVVVLPEKIREMLQRWPMSGLRPKR